MSRTGLALGVGLLVNSLVFLLIQQLIHSEFALPDPHGEPFGAIRWTRPVAPPAVPRTDTQTAQERPPERPEAPTRPPAEPPPIRSIPAIPQVRIATTRSSPSIEWPDLDALLARLPNPAPLSLPAAAGEVPPGPGIVDIPVAKIRVPPIYPAMAKRLGIEGEVVVEFGIDNSGRVVEPRVVEARPTRLFEQAALQAISAWRFESSGPGNGAEPRKASQRFEFRLSD